MINCEIPTGSRPTSCPHRALADPFVLEIIKAHRWRAEGSLRERYGGAPPSYVLDAIEVYDAALNATQVHDIREDRAEREKQRVEANAKR